MKFCSTLITQSIFLPNCRWFSFLFEVYIVTKVDHAYMGCLRQLTSLRFVSHDKWHRILSRTVVSSGMPMPPPPQGLGFNKGRGNLDTCLFALLCPRSIQGKLESNDCIHKVTRQQDTWRNRRVWEGRVGGRLLLITYHWTWRDNGTLCQDAWEFICAFLASST